VGSSLIDMYAKCGSLEGVQQKCLYRMWSLGLPLFLDVKCGLGQKALELF
jgi:hypothetical protein